MALFRLGCLLAITTTVTLSAGCTTSSSSPGSSSQTAPTTVEPATSGSSTSEPEVALVGVYESVDFYPACGDETLRFGDDEWNQVAWVGSRAFTDELERLRLEIEATRRESPGISTPVGTDLAMSNPSATGVMKVAVRAPRVPAPGPGDDEGTLYVWEDDVARWVSHNGDLDVWLTKQPVTIEWIC